MSDCSAVDSVSSPRKKTATLATTISDNESVASSRILPRAPHPTPAGTVAEDLSVAGDLPSMAYIVDRVSGANFQGMPTGIRPNPSEYPEASIWAGLAMEDVENALKRLAMVAKDENALDDRKSVQEYYSERLAKILKEAEIEFDVKYMTEK